MEDNKMTNDDWKQFIERAIANAFAMQLSVKREFMIPKARACELLAKDPSTLYRWEKSGYLVPAVRRGRSVWYSSRDLERLGVVIE